MGGHVAFLLDPMWSSMRSQLVEASTARPVAQHFRSYLTGEAATYSNRPVQRGGFLGRPGQSPLQLQTMRPSGARPEMTGPEQHPAGVGQAVGRGIDLLGVPLDPLTLVYSLISSLQLATGSASVAH